MWLLCSSAVAYARPSISVKHSFYSISGRTYHDLRMQMNKAGPGADGIIGGDAHTKWEVKWRSGLTQIPGGCRVQNFTTSVHVTYLMPRWKNPSDGSPELRKKWDTYVKALQTHEDGHKDHGIHAAQEIEAGIAQLRPSSSCNDMQRAANTIAESILGKYRKKDLYYDILTIHGATQGAVFL
jgi:predicted secreted Zn-dependent protease